MTNKENVKYYNITELFNMFQQKISKEEFRNYFEQGKITGKKVENEWYADKEAIEAFMQILAKERAFMLETQKIDLTDIIQEGRILDIGGGGEGIIGQLKGENVVAIDLMKEELEGSSKAGDTKSLKIIMDATELMFLDDSFDIVTAFFSMMYMSIEDQNGVFKEIYRVLKAQGDLLIWDLNIPNRGNNEKDFFGITLEVKISGKTIEVGYATSWDKEQNIEYFIQLARKIGFKIIEQKLNEHYFFLRLKKT
ncbi:MAG: class I SAM-dependent methyltransferase [Candidatus Hodarchaeota archaeon]